MMHQLLAQTILRELPDSSLEWFSYILRKKWCDEFIDGANTLVPGHIKVVMTSINQDGSFNPLSIGSYDSLYTNLRYSSWSEGIGGLANKERVRVVQLKSIASNPRMVLDEISDWLGIDPAGMPRDLSVKNPRGQLSNSAYRRFLRQPPNWAFSLAKVVIPTRGLRKVLLDPIRSKGWKYVQSEKQEISDELTEKIRLNLIDDIEFMENLEKYIPKSVII